MFTCHWICSLNISQMFQFFFKEKFDVLSSRYRHVRNLRLRLVVLASFIFTIFKEANTPVISIHGPHLRGRRGMAGVRCWTITFCVGVTTLGHLPSWDFLLCRVGQRAGLLPSACPHSAGLIPGLWKVKIIIPAHHRRRGSSGYK